MNYTLNKWLTGLSKKRLIHRQKSVKEAWKRIEKY